MTLILMLAAVLAQADEAARARALVEKLRSDRLEEREEAARALQEMGQAAVPELEKAAADPDVEVAARARHILKVIPLLSELSPSLVKAHPGIGDRLAAGGAAWTEVFLEAVSGSGGRSWLRRDLGALAGKALANARIYAEGQKVLQGIEANGLSSAVPAILEEFRNNRLGLRSPAAFVLAELGAVEAADEAALLLGHADLQVRAEAAKLLGELGSAAFVPVLADRLKDPNYFVVERTIEALARLEARECLPEIRGLLEKQRGVSPFGVVQALLVLEGKEAVHLLRRGLKHENDSVRSASAFGLGKAGDRESIPEIAALLGETDWLACSVAMTALVELDAQDEAPRIAALLEDKRAGIASSAKTALEKLRARRESRARLEAESPEEKLTSALARLEDPNPTTRTYAVRDLAALGARDRAPDVARLLRDPSEYVRWRALESLEKLGGLPVKEDLPFILGVSPGRYKVEVTSILCRMGFREAVPAVLDVCRDVRWGVPSKGGGNELFYRSLSPLNALAERASWDRLARVALDEVLVGSRKDLVERLAKKAGLEVEWSRRASPKEDTWLSAPARIGPADGTPMDLLSSLLRGRRESDRPSRFEYVLEGNRLRVLRFGEALERWEAWWEKSK